MTDKQEQGEPVAYIRKDQLQKAAKSTFFCEVTPEPRQDRIGIYTTPQQRKPLTGEQIIAITKQYALSLAFPYDGPTTPELFARAIEAAHGITK